LTGFMCSVLAKVRWSIEHIKC